MTTDRETLVGFAYCHSNEMGQAVEDVIKAQRHPTLPQVQKVYGLLKRDGGKHLSPDVFMGLLASIRTRASSSGPGLGGETKQD